MASEKFMGFFQLLVDKKITVEQLGENSPEELSKMLDKQVAVVFEKSNEEVEKILQDIDGFQGYEEQIFKVLHIQPDNVYVQINGLYDSYGGKEWKGIPFEVFPKTVEQVVYTSESGETPSVSAKLTFEQILGALRMGGWDNEKIGDGLEEEDEIEGIGTVEMVKDWGGEGQGDDIGHVFHFAQHNVYMRIDGYYQSHHGSDWDNDPYEVKPQAKQVTVYEKP
jgi:hypothetical protein